MAAPGWKSRKLSDASSTSAQPRDVVFFIDKCLGLKTVPNALRAIGEHVELKTDHFPQNADDPTWVPEVGAKGWIILSADQRLTHNHIEIVALLKSNTHSFILTSGSMTGQEMATAFTKAIPKMKELIASTTPPAVYKVSKSGDVRLAFTRDGLKELAADAKRRERK